MRFDPLIFTNYIQPRGYLTNEPATHACFYYAVCARRTFEDFTEENLMYEGEKDHETNYRQLFVSIAKLYNVKPEEMEKCWGLVDKQFDAASIPRLPNEARYRFNNKLTVV